MKTVYDIMFIVHVILALDDASTAQMDQVTHKKKANQEDQDMIENRNMFYIITK